MVAVDGWSRHHLGSEGRSATNERHPTTCGRYPAYSHAILLLVTPILFAACAKDKITKPVTYTLTGQVRLVGGLRNDAGDSTDVQRVENADSVRVYLYQGSTRK